MVAANFLESRKVLYKNGRATSLEQTVDYLMEIVWQQEDRIRKLEGKPSMQEDFDSDGE